MLAGCAGSNPLDSIMGEKDERLPGQREAVLVQTDALSTAMTASAEPIVIPAAVTNPNWTQPGGVPSNAPHNLYLGTDLRRAFSLKVGVGSNKDGRLTASPIVVGGRVYVLDSEAWLHGVDANSGAKVMKLPLAPRGRDGEGAFGGGLASDGINLYATTAFGEAIAIDLATGRELWRQKFPAPFRSAPTVADGRLFMVTIGNEVFGLSTADGSTLWRHQGSGEQASIIANSSPAVSDGFVVVPSTTGDVSVFAADTGYVIWTENLAASDPTTSLANMNDVAARPVVDGGKVFAIAHAGRMVAVDLANGQQVWSLDISGTQTPWVAGETVFVITGNHLSAISKQGGQVLWSIELPGKSAKWGGPVVGGGWLLAVSSLGELIRVSPQTGEITSTTKLGEPFYIPPVIAGGSIYILSDTGKLFAYR